ncbi:hypothetical protein [Streptomyces telluris]|uniref:Uncharacterized protein n=1 Tax=Streptomyces telluris TaxID=2720021 RepID=A0A9X2LIG7_9ACTN|nr:hypothetical protein [Streptomyces telluris]MCQ8771773.1 hypothetical protein [Streptomyces telluris]NJP78764.1 hypothetical protein [Streptomyces telluris]
MAVRTATPVTGWLLRGSDGRLTAYAPAEGGVVRWTETRPGGPEWTGPELLAVPGLEACLSIAQSPQGYVYLVGVRQRETEAGEVDTDIVYATQFQPGRPPTNWRSIGSPHGPDRQRSAQLGVPTAAVDSTGLQVFVRNSGGGVCGRRQDARGIWGPWTDMKGSHVLDGLTASATPSGRIELLAPASEFVLRWRQEQPGGPVRRVRNVPAKPGACSATAGVTGEDRITHFWRDAVDGELHTLAAETAAAAEAGGDADAEPATASVGGTGSGAVAVLHAVLDGHECTVLAQRAASGLPAVAVCPSGDEVLAAQWSETGEEFAGAPALALDAAGRVTVAVLGMDGHLRVARQRGDAAGLALGAWERV